MCCESDSCCHRVVQLVLALCTCTHFVNSLVALYNSLDMLGYCVQCGRVVWGLCCALRATSRSSNRWTSLPLVSYSPLIIFDSTNTLILGETASLVLRNNGSWVQFDIDPSAMRRSCRDQGSFVYYHYSCCCLSIKSIVFSVSLAAHPIEQWRAVHVQKKTQIVVWSKKNTNL